MLELRPICENCACALPPNSAEARICSFECTFCAECVETVLDNVCPNYGGGFASRPVRPQHDWRGGNCLERYPASAKLKHRPVDLQIHMMFAGQFKDLPPGER